MTTEPDRLTRMERAVEHAMDAIKSWVLSKGGTVISGDPCVSIYEVGIHHLEELRVLVDRFKEHTNLDCWSGVGNTMADSVRAADFAKKRNLDKPFLMQEDIEDQPQEPPLSVLKSEEEDLNKSLKRTLTGAGIAAILSAPIIGSMADKMRATQSTHPMATASEGAKISSVKQPKTKTKPAPEKSNAPIEVKPHLKGTFVESYKPTTLHHGTNDAMFVIGLAESQGGKDLEHKQEMKLLTHPLTGEKLHIDNTAFAQFGMRPFTALESSVRNLSSVGGLTTDARDRFVEKMLGKPMSELVPAQKIPMVNGKINMKAYANQKAAIQQAKRGFYEEAANVFMHRFKTEPEFYNDVAMMHLGRVAKIFGKSTKNGYTNPVDIFSGWNQGEFTKEPQIKNNPKYRHLILSRLKNALEHGMKFDFSPQFGKAGHEALIREAMNYSPDETPPKAAPKIPTLKGKKPLVIPKR